MRLLAFAWKDGLIRSSYRISALMSVGHVLFSAASFFFIGKLIDPSTTGALQPYGGAYFPFVLLGLACSRYLAISLSGFAGSLREEQLQATLEPILSTPTSLVVVALGSIGWEVLWATVEFACFLGVGAMCFGLDLSRVNITASVVVLLLSIGALSSLGLLSASGTLLFQEFDPFTWVLGGAMKLLGGVYFPVALLPGWLKTAAGWCPLTYTLEGLRQAMLLGKPLKELTEVCVVLGLFAMVLWPVALASFSWTIRRLKVTGSLNFR